MIDLGNNWFVDKDDYAFTVKRKRYIENGKNAGGMTWEHQTWHATFDQLKRKISELQMKSLIENEGFLRSFELIDNFSSQEEEIKAL